MTQDTQTVQGGDYAALRSDLQALRDTRGPVTKAAIDKLLKRHPAQVPEPDAQPAEPEAPLPEPDAQLPAHGRYDDVAYDPRNYA